MRIKRCFVPVLLAAWACSLPAGAQVVDLNVPGYGTFDLTVETLTASSPPSSIFTSQPWYSGTTDATEATAISIALGSLLGTPNTLNSFPAAPFVVSEITPYGAYGLQGGSLTYLDLSTIQPETYVVAAPVPEPSSFFAGALLVVPLGLQGVRKLRQPRTPATS